MNKVVPSAAGSVVLVLVLFIWLRVRKRRRNDENQPLLDVDQNECPDRIEGIGSASLNKPSSSGSSCSGITVPNKDNLNSMLNDKVTSRLRNSSGALQEKFVRVPVSIKPQQTINQ